MSKTIGRGFIGPNIIARVSDNNMANIKTLQRTKEYNYNTHMLKMFHPENKESPVAKASKK